MITFLNTKIEKFTNIFHIADIHVRLNSRHEEYNQIFNKLYEQIKQTPNETVVVLVGDIFHNKIVLSPESIQMATDLFKSIANIRPLILVPGNHDTILSNKSRLDSLTPVVDALNHSNLYYLKSSGLYGFGNILWNNMSVFDVPEKYIMGKDIPSIYRNKYEHIIALYHGSVDKASTGTGYSINNPSVTPLLFDHHHISLLGDIHLKQDLSIDKDEIIIHEDDVKNYDLNLWDIIEEIPYNI